MLKLKSVIKLSGISFFLVSTSAYSVECSNLNSSDPNQAAIISFCDNQIISINSPGAISTTSIDSNGIYSTGDNNSITNAGSISTSGGSISDTIMAYSASNGIYTSGVNNTITNSGNISTLGYGAAGIYSTGDFVNIINTGVIRTSGSDGLGIYSVGLNARIVNNNYIETNSTAVFLNHDSYFTNNGTLKVNLPYHSAVDSTSYSHVTNNGFIWAASYGLSLGNNSEIFNNGTIKTDAVNGVGVLLRSGSSLTNAGYLKGSLGSVYVYGDSTVNLNRGSILIGDLYIFSGPGAKLNIHLGSGASYAYSVNNRAGQGTWTITDLDNRPMVTGSAYAAGIGAQETASEMLYQRTSSVTSALDRRLRSYASDEPDNQPYWLDVYYGDTSRNAGGDYSTQTAFSNYNYGMTAGFKLPSEVTPLELVINAHQNNLNIDSSSQKIDSTSIMAGVLAPSIADVLGAKLSAKAMVGYAEHDGDRKVMTNSQLYDGSRQIKSDYHSTYLVLGTALTKLHPITDHLTADVLLGLDLNTERVESYKESDYFAWDGRTLTQVQSRVQAGLNYAFNENKASVFARVGAENRNLIGGATQDYEINNTAVSFNTNNKNDTYLTAQVGIKAQLEKRIQLFGVLSTLHSSDSVNSVSGNIGIRADF